MVFHADALSMFPEALVAFSRHWNCKENNQHVNWHGTWLAAHISQLTVHGSSVHCIHGFFYSQFAMSQHVNALSHLWNHSGLWWQMMNRFFIWVFVGVLLWLLLVFACGTSVYTTTYILLHIYYCIYTAIHIDYQHRNFHVMWAGHLWATTDHSTVGASLWQCLLKLIWHF